MGQILQACQRRRHEAPPPPSIPEERPHTVNTQVLRDWRQRLDQCSVVALMHAQSVHQDRAKPETPATMLPPDLKTKWVAVSHPPEARGIYASMKACKELHGSHMDQYAMYQRWPSKSEALEYNSMFDQHLEKLQQAERQRNQLFPVPVLPSSTAFLQAEDASFNDAWRTAAQEESERARASEQPQ